MKSLTACLEVDDGGRLSKVPGGVVLVDCDPRHVLGIGFQPKIWKLHFDNESLVFLIEMMYYLMYVGNFSNKNKTPENLKSLKSYKDNFLSKKYVLV